MACSSFGVCSSLDSLILANAPSRWVAIPVADKTQSKWAFRCSKNVQCAGGELASRRAGPIFSVKEEAEYHRVLVRIKVRVASLPNDAPPTADC